MVVSGSSREMASGGLSEAGESGRDEAVHGGVTLVDAHVHLYKAFDLQVALDAATRNFAREAVNRHGSDPFVGVLLLADPTGEGRFSELKAFSGSQDSAGVDPMAGWRLRATTEDEALIAERRDGNAIIVVIAGRQIATGEGLEVLALFTRRQFPDGMAFFNTVDLVMHAGAMAVVPWGFGKWLGRRGRLVRRMMIQAEPADVFFADSGARPVFCPRSPLLRDAERLGAGVMAGSDPFPFAWEVDRIGSYGISFPGMLSLVEPIAGLRELFRDAMGTSRRYGTLQGPYRFLRNQVGIRI